MYYLDEDLLNDYLYYGDVLFPRDDRFFHDLVRYKRAFSENNDDIVRTLHDPSSLSVAVQYGVDVFRKAVEDTLSTDGSNNKLHVIPLSGGLDSRAILACLLSYLDRKSILTVTYGWKGTLDFEIGRLISRKASVDNVSVDTSEFRWNTCKLLSACRTTGWDCFSTPGYVHSFLGLGSENIYWTGFMGDPLAGGHLTKEPSHSWQGALDKFVGKHRLKPTTLLPPDSMFSPHHRLPQEPLVDRQLIGYDLQLDYAIRQGVLIRRNRYCQGYDWRTPFTHPQWAGMCLNLPRILLRDEVFYRRVLAQGFPQLFRDLPDKRYGKPAKKHKPKAWRYGEALLRYGGGRGKSILQRHGLLPYRPAAGINQIEIDWAIRERPDVRSVVRENLEDLRRRSIIGWVDLTRLWDDHNKRVADYGDILLSLALLELRIKAGIIR